MSSRFSISVPERDWMPASEAPKDGSIVFMRDDRGEVDLMCFDRGEWAGELGTLDGEYTHYAKVSIATGPDRDGKCGRCGRVRTGP